MRDDYGTPSALTQPNAVADLRWELGPLLDIAPDDLAADLAEGYRVLAQEALAALARATKKHQQQRERIAQLVAELKALRAFLMETDRAA